MSPLGYLIKIRRDHDRNPGLVRRMAQLLLDNDADVNCENSNGITPLDSLFNLFIRDRDDDLALLLLEEDFHPRVNAHHLYVAILNDASKRVLSALLNTDHARHAISHSDLKENYNVAKENGNLEAVKAISEEMGRRAARAFKKWIWPW